MAEYRDPKVTNATSKGGSSVGKWIGIIIAVIVALLLLGWLLGWFAEDTAEIGAVEPAVVEEPAVTAVPVVE